MSTRDENLARSAAIESDPRLHELWREFMECDLAKQIVDNSCRQLYDAFDAWRIVGRR